MANIRVTCPTCNSELEIDAEYVGQEVECGSCLQVFVAEAKPSGSGRKIPGSSTGKSKPASKPKRKRRRDDDDEYDHDRRDDYDDDDYAPPRRRRSEGGTGLAVTSLVLGIASIPMACCCGLFALPLSFGAAICGGIAMKNPEGKGMAVAGLVLGILGIALTILSVAIGIGMNLNNQQFR
jgi:predicted Zn finger-like uncharacterized protein